MHILSFVCVTFCLAIVSCKTRQYTDSESPRSRSSETPQSKQSGLNFIWHESISHYLKTRPGGSLDTPVRTPSSMREQFRNLVTPYQTVEAQTALWNSALDDWGRGISYDLQEYEYLIPSYDILKSVIKHKPYTTIEKEFSNGQTEGFIFEAHGAHAQILRKKDGTIEIKGLDADQILEIYNAKHKTEERDAVENPPPPLDVYSLSLEEFSKAEQEVVAHLADKETPWTFISNFRDLPDRMEVIATALQAKERQFLLHIKEELGELTSRNLLVYLEQHEPRSYVEKKLAVQARVWDKMQSNPKMKSLPFEDIYRFVIDGDQEKKGSYIFETEPGYILASLTALEHALSENLSISFGAYVNLHKELTEGVWKIKSTWKMSSRNFEKFPQRVDDGGTGFSGVQKLDHDDIGLKDLDDRGTIDPDAKKGVFLPFLYHKNLEGDSIDNSIGKLPSKERDKILNNLFSSFNAYLAKDESPVMRLIAYSWLARELELRHIFSDGNGRSSAMLLYSLVARDKDIPMIMFHNPNILDANGPEKLLYRLLQDAQNFKNNGTWTMDSNHQHDGRPKHLSNLKIDEEFQGLVQEGIEKVAGKDWAYFHGLIFAKNGK